ncbi:hypothetical protein HDU84_003847 [Entophlyctis sp. JEL0112]|nr:hypothetical protein HDU84_003847 [Entophlyctis sp. JEL0112]
MSSSNSTAAALSSPAIVGLAAAAVVLAAIVGAVAASRRSKFSLLPCPFGGADRRRKRRLQRTAGATQSVDSGNSGDFVSVSSSPARGIFSDLQGEQIPGGHVLANPVSGELHSNTGPVVHGAAVSGNSRLTEVSGNSRLNEVAIAIFNADSSQPHATFTLGDNFATDTTDPGTSSQTKYAPSMSSGRMPKENITPTPSMASIESTKSAEQEYLELQRQQLMLRKMQTQLSRSLQEPGTSSELVPTGTTSASVPVAKSSAQVVTMVPASSAPPSRILRTVVKPYTPSGKHHIPLMVGDRVTVTFTYPDGFAFGHNKTRNLRGQFPIDCLNSLPTPKASSVKGASISSSLHSSQPRRPQSASLSLATASSSSLLSTQSFKHSRSNLEVPRANGAQF